MTPGGLFSNVGHSKTLEMDNSEEVWNGLIPKFWKVQTGLRRLFFQSFRNYLARLDRLFRMFDG